MVVFELEQLTCYSYGSSALSIIRMSFVRNQQDFSRHVNVTKKRCLCLRSNMTKRGKGLQKPQCSVCGSRSHRIETCSHPLAEKMRCLIAENRKLKGAKKHKSAEGKQNRRRKNKQFQKSSTQKVYRNRCCSDTTAKTDERRGRGTPPNSQLRCILQATLMLCVCVRAMENM